MNLDERQKLAIHLHIAQCVSCRMAAYRRFMRHARRERLKAVFIFRRRKSYL